MGGVEQVIFQLAEGGIPLGICSEVLSLSRKGNARGEWIGHHQAHRSRLDFDIASTGFSLPVIRDFNQLARESDLIHYHFPWPYMDLLHLLVQHGKPTVLTYHSDIVKQRTLLKLYRPLMEHFLSSVDHIVATSPNYLQSSEVLQRYRDKVSVIPIGLDQGTYPSVPPERLAHWRKQVGDRFFLFVGALRYYKGLSFLLQAMGQKPFPLVILGNGPLDSELKAQARINGLDHVHFLGSLSDTDKSALLTLCTALVFPSHLRSEAFGISLLEAAMFGKPMISCEIGTGTSYVNIDGVTGYVVPPAAPAALARAMEDLWFHSDLAASMGERAKQRFDQLFSAKDMVSEYSRIYHLLLERRQ